MTYRIDKDNVVRVNAAYPGVLTPGRDRRLAEWEKVEAARLEALVRSQIAVYVNAEIEAIARFVEASPLLGAELGAAIRGRAK